MVGKNGIYVAIIIFIINESILFCIFAEISHEFNLANKIDILYIII